MSDDTKTLSEPPSSPGTAKKPSSMMRKLLLLAVVFVFTAGIFAANFWLVMHGRNHPVAATVASTDTAPRLAALERKMEALDARVTDLAARVDDVAATASASAANAARGNSAADLSHMQSELAALASTVNGIEAEAASARAQSIAFVQLREAAMSGHGFAHELDALQGAAKSDGVLRDLCSKLTPYAANGAPAEVALRDELATQIAVADKAIAKATAQSWWERVLAELKGLVSIRPLHGAASANAGLDSMQQALDRNDLGSALDEIKNLPPEAQKALDGWRQRAEARRAVDTGLQALADRLIAAPDATPPAQGTP